jgi:hypothetical protein
MAFAAVMTAAVAPWAGAVARTSAAARAMEDEMPAAISDPGLPAAPTTETGVVAERRRRRRGERGTAR